MTYWLKGFTLLLLCLPGLTSASCDSSQLQSGEFCRQASPNTWFVSHSGFVAPAQQLEAQFKTTSNLTQWLRQQKAMGFTRVSLRYSLLLAEGLSTASVLSSTWLGLAENVYVLGLDRHWQQLIAVPTGPVTPTPRQHFFLPELAQNPELLLHLDLSQVDDERQFEPPVLSTQAQLQRLEAGSVVAAGLLLGALSILLVGLSVLAYVDLDRRQSLCLLAMMSLASAVWHGLTAAAFMPFSILLGAQTVFHLASLSFVAVAVLLLWFQCSMPLNKLQARPTWLAPTAGFVALTLISLSMFIEELRDLDTSMWLLLVVVYLCLCGLYVMLNRAESQHDYWEQVGLLLLALGLLVDALAYRHSVQLPFLCFSVCLLFFVSFQCGRLLNSYRQLFSQQRNQAENLQQKNVQLQHRVLKTSEELEAANAKLEKFASTDVLTGSSNKRAYEREIRKEILRARRMHTPMSFALVEVDWCAEVVERYGCEFGADVLQSVADCLLRRLRATDFVARIDKDVFAIILPNTASAEAMKVLDGCCQMVSGLSFSSNPEFQASISIGTASWQEWVSRDELYTRAENALFQARGHGKNQVVYAAIFTSKEKNYRMD